MKIHSFRKENFGYIVASKDGKIGLFDDSVSKILLLDPDYDDLSAYKLKTICIPEDFHLKSPLIAWLEVTRLCNYNCDHCFTNSGPNVDTDNELGTQEWLALLNQLKEMEVFCIVFTGGEPFLRPDFMQILSYAHALGFVISVATNGTPISSAILKKLPRSNLRITISLDGLHSHHGGASLPAVETVTKKLLMLKEEKIPCHVCSVMTTSNLKDLEKALISIQALGISFRVIPFVPIGRGAFHNELQLTDKDVEDAARLWEMEVLYEASHADEIGLTFSTFYDFSLNLVYMGKACKGGRYLAYVAANGDVYPCTTCVGTDAYAGGNVRLASFDEIWTSSFSIFRKLAEWKNYSACSNCTFSANGYFCAGRCPPLSMKYRGEQHDCGATPYDRGSLVTRTRFLQRLGRL